MIYYSVEDQFQIWIRTREYLLTQKTNAHVEECHKPEEAEWMCNRYKKLLKKIQGTQIDF